jgi:hypothetical protein
MVTTSTMKVVSSGAMTGENARWASCIGVSAGSCTSTGMGADGAFRLALPKLRGGAGRDGATRCSVSAALPRKTSARPTVFSCTVSILRSMAT